LISAVSSGITALQAMSDRAAATAAISTGLFMQDPFGYLISGLSRSDCRSQPPHRELDLPAWQLAPMLDLARVGRLRVAIEELPHRLAGVVTGLGEGLAHETIAGAVLRAMIAHPLRQLTRGLEPCHRSCSK